MKGKGLDKKNKNTHTLVFAFEISDHIEVREDARHLTFFLLDKLFEWAEGHLWFTAGWARSRLLRFLSSFRLRFNIILLESDPSFAHIVDNRHFL